MAVFRFFLAFLLFSFISCSSDTNTIKINELGDPLYSLKISPSESNIDWDDLIESIVTIPLENNIEALLGKIDKIEIKDNKLFLLDVMHRKLNVFELPTGKFLTSIGRRGKGPGEFLDVRDFCIINDTIFCLDYNRVNKYDLETFEFLSSIRFTAKEAVDTNPVNFVYYNDNKYYIWNNQDKNVDKDSHDYFLLEFKNNKNVNSYFKHNGARFFEDKMFFSTTQHNEYMMAPAVGYNNISLITNTGVTNYINIDFDGKNIPRDYIDAIKKEKEYFNILLTSDYYKVFKHVVDIDRRELYFNLIGPQGYLFEGIVNLERNDYKFSQVNLDNSPLFTNYENGYLYGYYDALYAHDLLKRFDGKKSKFFAELEKLSIGREDNFIFFKIKLKL